MAASETQQPRPPVEELNAAQCWAHLREQNVGRLAVVVDRRPDIFPVNYVVDGGAVVFRTGSGNKLTFSDGKFVAFEADGWDETTGVTWSVVIRGRAKRTRQFYDTLRAMELPLTPWHPGSKPWFVQIEPSTITGRQFVRVR